MPLGNPIRKQNESRIISVLATEGQSVFTVEGGYIINQISVFRNGVRLSNAEDFTAGDGSSVTLNDAANVDDRIEFHVFDRFTVNNAIVGAASSQTISGDLVVNGKLFGNLDVPSVNTGIITATELDLNGKGDISGDLTVTRHLSVGGISTFTGAVDANGGATIDNVRIGVAGNNDIDTDSGNLFLDSTGGQVKVKNHFEVTGVSTFSSDVSIVDKIVHTGDTDTAIRFPGNDIITIERSGSEVFRIDSEGLKIPDKLIHQGDTNTAIRFPEADTITFETGSVERVRIKSNGNVGLGTVDPTSHNNTNALQIHDDYIGAGNPRIRLTNITSGSGSGDGFELSVDGSNLHGIIRQRENADIAFYTNNTEKLRLTSAGHVVPSTDSAYDLGLTGTRFRAAYVDTYYGDGSNLTGITGTTINNNADNRIITGSGTANTLEGESTFTYNGTHIAKIDTGQTYAQMQLDGNTGGMVEFFENGTRKWEIYGSDPELAIYDRDKGSYHARFKAGGNLELTDGKLLIGTTTPGYSGADDLTLYTTGDTGLTIRSGTSNQSTIAFADGTSSSEQYRGFVQYFHNDDSLYLGTSGANRLKIDSSGHLLPNADSTFNIGADVLRFNNGYFDNIYGRTFTINGVTTPVTINHTGGAALRLSRSSKNLDLNANYAASNTHATIDVTSGMDLRFQIGGADKVTLDSSGSLWIGTTSGINNSGYGGLSVNGGSGSLLSMMQNGTEYLRIFGDSNPALQHAGALRIFSGVSGGSNTWSITDNANITGQNSVTFNNKSNIQHVTGVMAVSSSYNSGDLYVRIDNIYNLPGNAWWTFNCMLISAQVEGGLGGHHSLVTSILVTGLGSWSSVGKTDIVGTCNVSVSQHGSNFVELQFDFSDSSRGPNTFICNGGTFDPPRISFH